MITIRCTAKLLKRLRQPSKPPEPAASGNPLGEWYADIRFIDREPFVVMLNAATGASLVLPGRAKDLRKLPALAKDQLRKLFLHFDFDITQPTVAAELAAWDVPPVYARTLDRSLLGTLNRVTFEAWHHFAHFNRSLPDAAAGQWSGLFTHPSLPRHPRIGSNTWRPVDLVRGRLVPENEMQPAGDQPAWIQLIQGSSKLH